MSDRMTCPECEATNEPGEALCRECGSELSATAVTSAAPKPRPLSGDDENRPRRRRPCEDDDDDRSIARETDHGAASLLVPIGVSGWAVAAGYLGLIGCIPLVGIPFALLAILCGVLALTKGRSAGTFGKASGVMRAVIGIALGTIGVLFSIIAAIAMAVG